MSNNIYEYNEISTQQWIEILKDNTIMNSKMKKIIDVIYQTENKKLNAQAIAEILGDSHYGQLNIVVGRCGKMIKETYAIPQTSSLENHKSWIVVFNGEEISNNGKICFNWILKSNMITALEQIQAQDVPSIRILPMNSVEEFENQTIEDVQDEFFKETLLKRNGKYYFKKSSMVAPPSTLVLFQYNNSIIASAKLRFIEKFEVSIQDEYMGAYHFDLSSIEIFQPITISEIQLIIPTVKQFSQAKQKFDGSYASEIQELIKSKKIEHLPEEIPMKAFGRLKEGAKRQIIVNAYERNYTARRICLEHYGYTCCVCGFDFGSFYGAEFEGKIHVHHLKALAEINSQYLIDPIKDLRPVCPNCHLALHSKEGNVPYTIEELKGKIRIRSTSAT